MIYASLLTALAFSASLTSAVPLKRASGVTLRPANGDQCLATSAGVGNGVGIVSTPCSQIQTTDPSKAGYALWDISPGDQQSVKLTGTNFCLDAGDNPGTDSRGAKIWTCYPGLPQQRWYYTDDQHIAITGGNTCLSEGRYGTTTEACGLSGGAIGTQQFYSVAPGTTTTIQSTSAGPTTTVASTSAVSSKPLPSSTPVTPPPVGGNKIYWNGDKTKCLTVDGGAAVNGAGLVIVGCFADGDTFDKFQRWDIQRGAGAIKLHGTNLCIDYGLSPGNGVGGKIWQCYDGAPQQNSYYTDDNHIAQTGGSVCLDVRAESGPGYNKPYGSLKSVQEYQCTGGNGNQIFTL